jgi:hypothetical protein
MTLGVQPRDLWQLAGPHHQLVADDELAYLQRLGQIEAHVVDRILSAADLADDIADRDLGKRVDEVPGKGGPVRMRRAAPWKRFGSPRCYRKNERSGRLGHEVLR